MDRKKGRGYFGRLARPGGDYSTELSVGVDWGDGETEIPSLVPTLTKQEREYLLAGNKATRAIVQKAVDHAKQRIRAGKSPFAGGDDRMAYQPKLDMPGGDSVMKYVKSGQHAMDAYKRASKKRAEAWAAYQRAKKFAKFDPEDVKRKERAYMEISEEEGRLFNRHKAVSQEFRRNKIEQAAEDTDARYRQDVSRGKMRLPDLPQPKPGTLAPGDGAPIGREPTEPELTITNPELKSKRNYSIGGSYPQFDKNTRMVKVKGGWMRMSAERADKHEKAQAAKKAKQNAIAAARKKIRNSAMARAQRYVSGMAQANPTPQSKSASIVFSGGHWNAAESARRSALVQAIAAKRGEALRNMRGQMSQSFVGRGLSGTSRHAAMVGKGAEDINDTFDAMQYGYGDTPSSVASPRLLARYGYPGALAGQPHMPQPYQGRRHQYV